MALSAAQLAQSAEHEILNIRKPSLLSYHKMGVLSHLQNVYLDEVFLVYIYDP